MGKSKSTDAPDVENRIEIDEPAAARRGTVLDTVLRVALVIALMAAVVVTVLVVRDIPRAGEAPTTAAQAAINRAMTRMEEDPSSVMARLGLADAYFQHRMYEEALVALDDAQSLEPTSSAAAYVEIGYGRVYEAMGDLPSAIDHYNESLKLDKSFDALYALGNMASADGESQQAIDYWLQALEITPRAATLRVDIASEYESLGEYGPALEQLTEAARYVPNDPDIMAATERVQALATQP